MQTLDPRTSAGTAWVLLGEVYPDPAAVLAVNGAADGPRQRSFYRGGKVYQSCQMTCLSCTARAVVGQDATGNCQCAADSEGRTGCQRQTMKHWMT